MYVYTPVQAVGPFPTFKIPPNVLKLLPPPEISYMLGAQYNYWPRPPLSVPMNGHNENRLLWQSASKHVEKRKQRQHHSSVYTNGWYGNVVQCAKDWDISPRISQVANVPQNVLTKPNIVSNSISETNIQKTRVCVFVCFLDRVWHDARRTARAHTQHQMNDQTQI